MRDQGYNVGDPFIKVDDFLLVNTYRSMGPADDKKKDGQMSLKIRTSINNNWTKYTLITGVTKLLGTNYENNAKLREIKIPNNIPIVQEQTKKSIINYFLKDYDYDMSKMQSRKRLNAIFYSNNTFYWMMANSRTIGELIDKMKELKKNFKKEEDKEYEKWKINQEAEKYNL